MKVIFITREGYNLSGARVRCYNFARELRKYGVDTEVFSFADNLGAAYGEKELAMSCWEKGRYSLRAITALFKKEKDSIFFIQRLNYHSAAPLLISLFRRNKVIFDCDDWNIRENPVYYLGVFPSSKMEFLTRRLAGCADVRIAASVFLQDYLSRFGKKVVYLPTGVDTELFKPRENNKDSSRITLGWTGTCYSEDMYANLRFVIDCFNGLAAQHGNIFLSLAGEGSFFEQIKRELNSNVYKERIVVNDWIPPDQIPDYLNSIDIGLVPLIQNTKFNQAKSPTKLFEYLAMALPTVSSRMGEAPRIIKDGENGFLSGNKEEFIEKAGLLANDADLRRQMGEDARKTVERDFSLTVLGRQLYGVLQSI